jgi:uncharacterized protein with HEPN domain
MPHDPRKSLGDIQRAADFLVQLTSHRTVDESRIDEVFRSAVERKFEIIGEALNRLQRIDPALAAIIPQHRQIISFRNILLHSYDVIDDQVVWDIVQKDLQPLLQEVLKLLESFKSGEDCR